MRKASGDDFIAAAIPNASNGSWIAPATIVMPNTVQNAVRRPCPTARLTTSIVSGPGTAALPTLRRQIRDTSRDWVPRDRALLCGSSLESNSPLTSVVPGIFQGGVPRLKSAPRRNSPVLMPADEGEKRAKSNGSCIIGGRSWLCRASQTGRRRSVRNIALPLSRICHRPRLVNENPIMAHSRKRCQLRTSRFKLAAFESRSGHLSESETMITQAIHKPRTIR